MLKLKYDEFVTFQKQNILVGALESLTKIFIYDTDTCWIHKNINKLKVKLKHF